MAQHPIGVSNSEKPSAFAVVTKSSFKNQALGPA